MRELTLTEIKNIQLDILDYFHKVCVENHIDYYLSSGTLLGAIKYDGYIPWDDDIDVWIKAEDLERLEKIINGKNNRYHFCDCMHEENYPLSYCKVMRTDTVVVENAHSFRNYPLGINIDVFVLYKSDKTKIEKNKKRIHFRRNVYKRKALCAIKGEPTLKNIAKTALHHSAALHSYSDNAKRLRQLVEMCAGNDCYFNAYENAVVEYELEDFKTPILHVFEERNLYIPNGYDRILRTRYGDYTKDLPESQKVTHHNNKCYLKDENI